MAARKPITPGPLQSYIPTINNLIYGAAKRDIESDANLLEDGLKEVKKLAGEEAFLRLLNSPAAAFLETACGEHGFLGSARILLKYGALPSEGSLAYAYTEYHKTNNSGVLKDLLAYGAGIANDVVGALPFTEELTRNAVVIGSMVTTEEGTKIPITRETPGFRQAITTINELIEHIEIHENGNWHSFEKQIELLPESDLAVFNAWRLCQQPAFNLNGKMTVEVAGHELVRKLLRKNYEAEKAKRTKATGSPVKIARGSVTRGFRKLKRIIEGHDQEIDSTVALLATNPANPFTAYYVKQQRCFQDWPACEVAPEDGTDLSSVPAYLYEQIDMTDREALSHTLLDFAECIITRNRQLNLITVESITWLLQILSYISSTRPDGDIQSRMFIAFGFAYELNMQTSLAKQAFKNACSSGYQPAYEHCIHFGNRHMSTISPSIIQESTITDRLSYRSLLILAENQLYPNTVLPLLLAKLENKVARHAEGTPKGDSYYKQKARYQAQLDRLTTASSSCSSDNEEVLDARADDLEAGSSSASAALE